MRTWILIIAVLAGTIVMPTHAYAASKTSSDCPNEDGQYYRPLLPFYDSRAQRVELVQRYTYEVVQVLADHVQEAYFLGWGAWSPSCRYFAFAVGPWKGNRTYMWDSIDQKMIGIFQRPTYSGLYYLTWGDSDSDVIVGSLVGQFLWKIPSNEQIQMNYHDGWVRYTWDSPRNQVLTFDGRAVVAYDLNTGKIAQKYITPFFWYLTYFDFSPDGKTITLYDPNYDKWSVTWDRGTGKIVDVQAIGGRRSQDVQFTPDRRFIVTGGRGILIYTVSDGENPNATYWSYSDSIPADNYTWRFADSSTLELTYPKTGKQRLYDLNTGKFR